MSATSAKTPLYDWHVAHGGRMVDFAGWSMPVQYSSIVDEHQAVRRAAGLFDISHMGRLRFDGPEAALLLNHFVTREVTHLPPGRVCYALMTNEAGGILDDVLVYHLQDGAGKSYYLLVVNAGNRDKINQWITSHTPRHIDASWTDLSAVWAMIAVQGPKAAKIVQPLVDLPLSALRYYTTCETRIAGHGGIVSRTGYTGEDGFELIVGAPMAAALWNRLIEIGTPVGLVPAGLGCRDTLRLEAGMPLYGHELAEEIDPYQAGLGSAVQLVKGNFLGREALERLKAQPARGIRVGLRMSGKRVPREGYSIARDGRTVGHVTSGTFSPTLGHPVAMAYVEPESSQFGTQLSVDIRGRAEPAEVVRLPFYRR